MPVPFLDLRAQDHVVGAAVRAALDSVLDDQQWILGPHVERFETAMAAFCGVPHAVGVGSGTDALLLTLQALGVGPGMAVLTTPFTFFATASTIARLGARVLLADVDPRTLNLDPAAAAEALRRADGPVAGLVPVHLFGRVADMDALGMLAARQGLWVVEDAAQAAGATVGGVRAGAFGRAGCLSFYPSKNLGGVGDGGMVLTADAALAARLRQERHQGQTAPYEHGSLGACSRLDAVQAAVLGAKLPHLDAWNARRRTVAAWYTHKLVAAGLAGGADAPLTLPDDAGPGHVFHVYAVRARSRDALAVHLRAAGIGCQVYYRLPLHRQPALAGRCLTPVPLVEAERAAAEAIALPIYPEITEVQVDTVVTTVAAFYRSAL